MAFVAIFSQIKLLFGSLIIQLVWYILKQLFALVSDSGGTYLNLLYTSETRFNLSQRN